MSSARLGENVRPGALVISRPICAWYVGGSSRHSISTVVLVEGIRTPKCRVMLQAFPDGLACQTSSEYRQFATVRNQSTIRKDTRGMNDTMTLAERADALEHKMMRELDAIIVKSRLFNLADGDMSIPNG